MYKTSRNLSSFAFNFFTVCVEHTHVMSLSRSKKKKDAFTPTNSFDDVEGLITNLGILSALILSFVVGLVLTVPMEELDLADIRALVNFHPGFRNFIDPNRELRNKFNISKSIEAHQCVQDFEKGRLANPMLYEGLRQFEATVDIMQARIYIDRDYINIARHRCFGPRLPSHYLVSFGLATTLIFFAAVMLSTCLYISAAWLPVREDPVVQERWWKYGKWLVLLGYLLAVTGIVLFGYTLLLVVIIRFPHQQQFIFGLMVYGIMWGIIAVFAVVLPLMLTIHISCTLKRGTQIQPTKNGEDEDANINTEEIRGWNNE